MVNAKLKTRSAGLLLTEGDWTLLAERLALSPREVQVIRNVFSGATDRRIAEQLEISEHTVRSHVASIHKKLGVRSRSELFINVLQTLRY